MKNAWSFPMMTLLLLNPLFHGCAEEETEPTADATPLETLDEEMELETESQAAIQTGELGSDESSGVLASCGPGVYALAKALSIKTGQNCYVVQLYCTIYCTPITP